MTLKHLFDDFSTSGWSSSRSTPGGEETAPRAQNSTYNDGFEAGYSSGWEDAQRAGEEQSQKVSAELERTIQDLGFTYHEALDQLRGQFLDAIDQFIEALFPELAPDLIYEYLHAALENVGPSDTVGPVNLAIASGQRSLFEALLPESPPFEIELVEEESLGLDQAFIRMDTREQLVDFGPIVAGLREQIAAIRQKRARELKNVG